MANVEDCPGLETFGADVQAARKAKHLARKTLAEMVGIEWRYLANIENKGTIPSLPVVIQLIKICGLPVERYFNPEIMRGDSEQRQRVSHKLKLCPEHYLPVIANHPADLRFFLFGRVPLQYKIFFFTSLTRQLSLDYLHNTVFLLHR